MAWLLGGYLWGIWDRVYPQFTGILGKTYFPFFLGCGKKKIPILSDKTFQIIKSNSLICSS